jgi:hypothetical protein
LSVLAATATEVQFSWSAPLSDGGSVLISPFYAVTVSSTTPGAATPRICTIVGAATNCTASGLTNGAVYTFEVAAINRMGTGTAATTTYNVPSSNSSLSNLEISAGGTPLVLTPAFATGTTTYSASVPHTVASIDVSPTPGAQASTVVVTRRGGLSSQSFSGLSVWTMSTTSAIALSVGSNVIDVEVTASDPRFSTTYTITITRAAAPAPVPVFSGVGGGGSGGSPKTPSPPRDLPEPDTVDARPNTPVTIDPITSVPPAGDDWDTETMRIVDPATDREQTRVTSPEGVWELDPASGLVNFTPAEGFFGRAEVEFVITTRKGVTYRSLLSVYVARLNPTIPVTGAESSTPLVWGMWLLVAGLLIGSLSRRRRLL